MKKLVLLLCLIGVVAQGQIMKSLTQFAESPRGEGMFELNAGERVYSFAPDEDGWYKIRRRAWVDQGSIDGKLIAPGSQLYDDEGNIIGKTITDTKAKKTKKDDGFRASDRILVLIEAYVFKTKFEKLSVPEEKLEAILIIKNKNQQNIGLEELYATYEFEERKFGDLVAFVYQDRNYDLEETVDFRVIVIKRGSGIFAVCSNNHPLSFPKVKVTVDDDPMMTYFFYKPPASMKTQVDDIVYTYLSL